MSEWQTRGRRCLVVIVCLGTSVASAQDSAAGSGVDALRADQSDIGRSFLGGAGWTPSAEERKVLAALARNRPRRVAAAHGVIDDSGAARFVYEATVPTVICAPLQLCDIQLQSGEEVKGLHIGDQARWRVDAAVSGEAPNIVQHVIVHPQDIGLRTFLIVTTNRRTYRMRLVADEEKFMTSVSFSYPEDALAAFRRESEATGHSREAALATSVPVASQGSLQALSFAYELEGDAPPWKPVRVYNDGLQTVIDMPFAVRQTEAPTLLVVRAQGGAFTDDEHVQVNYRVHGTRYLVDTVFDLADLIAGVGPLQQRVRIRRVR